jgi:hypothetical protein
MAIVVELKPEMEARLRAVAESRGISVQDLARSIIEENASRAPSRPPTPEEAAAMYERLMRIVAKFDALPRPGDRPTPDLEYDEYGLPV